MGNPIAAISFPLDQVENPTSVSTDITPIFALCTRTRFDDIQSAKCRATWKCLTEEISPKLYIRSPYIHLKTDNCLNFHKSWNSRFDRYRSLIKSVTLWSSFNLREQGDWFSDRFAAFISSPININRVSSPLMSCLFVGCLSAVRNH